MKEKLAIVIAVLMITSMAFVISTTTVSAPSTFSASPGSATLSPTDARASTRVKFTVGVTNDTTDNIDNVRIIAPSGSNFTQGIGGVETAENLKLAADNLENAVAPLKRAGENLKLAADNKKAAGPDLVTAGENLMALTDSAWKANAGTGHFPAAENVFSLVYNAGDNLKKAGQEMAEASENFTLINAYLSDVAAKLSTAAGVGSDINVENWDLTAASYLDNAADNLQAAADNLLGGSLKLAGSYLENAGDNLKSAGTELGGTVGTALETAGQDLKDAGLKLQDAAQYNDDAGTNLVDAAGYLQSAGAYIELADPTDLGAAGDNLENAAANASGSIDSAGDNLTATIDNVLAAGAALSSAATYLANAATELGVALGGDELEDAMEHENAAAENLKVGDVDLGTAGVQLIAAADDLSAAATKLLATANALAPATWTLAEGTDYVQFNTFGENENWLNPGETLSFVFLWTTPTITIENTYTITITSNKEGGAAANWITEATVTLTVDGKIPTLTINVTQVGVTPAGTVNVVGTVLDNAKATITITASETLQSIENVYVENSGGTAENFLPPITMTTTDNIVYTGTFTVENWDDNVVVVRVSKVKDVAGNENTAGMENTVTVDTRAPIFVPPENSGLGTITTGMRENVVQAGTGTVFKYVDNDASKTITIRVEDNIANADNGEWVTSVTVDTSAATRSAVVDNLWSMDPLTLSAGFNSVITITATDRTGNTVSDNVENIFIDTQPPTIGFNTVAGKTWDENLELISDNTPEIKITVTDPGYPTSGLGVARENLKVYLDNNDNFLDTFPTWGGLLENKDTWVVSTGVFENLIDNAGKGLKDGTYYIWVFASDNLIRDGRENENAIRSFTIDTQKPLTGVGNFVVSDPIGHTVDDPVVYKTATRTIEGTVTSGEVGGTIKVYFNGVHQPTYDLVTTTTTWSRTITLPAGQTTKIQFTLTDKAGNESEKVLYGYAMPDATPPTVTITLPESGISTDVTSIILEATVTKDTWEEYSELTVRIDATSLTAPLTAVNVLSTDGKLTRAVELVEGTNTISVSAQDVAGNWSTVKTVTVTRTVTPWATYAIIIVIVALILAAIAIFRKR